MTVILGGEQLKFSFAYDTRRIDGRPCDATTILCETGSGKYCATVARHYLDAPNRPLARRAALTKLLAVDRARLHPRGAPDYLDGVLRTACGSAARKGEGSGKVICSFCQESPARIRGLCLTCYRHHDRHGTLGQFADAPAVPGRRRSQIAFSGPFPKIRLRLTREDATAQRTPT
jgi:hypothetical protein